MKQIAAVIATRFDPPQFESLRGTLARDGVTTITVRDDEPHGPDWSLYRLWNEGVGTAIEHGANYIAVLNDDITILPGTLPEMATMLRRWPAVGVVYPDWRRPTAAGFRMKEARQTISWEYAGRTPTEGTWGAGGMSGFAFMFRADLGIPFDEGYQWWFGDDAFEEAVRAKGLLVARIDGLPIDHTPGQSAAQLPSEEVAGMIRRDRERWETRTHYAVQGEAVTA